jgi:hypothetical protein
VIFYGLALLFAVAMCWHAVRSGQQLYWVFIILVLQPVGGLVYFALFVVPELLGGPTARRVRQEAQQRLDPTKAYREAKARFDDSPTVRTRMQLAEAAAGLGRHDEAETLYREAAQGVHSDDPALLLGRARALVELERHSEALTLLQRLGELGEVGRTADAALLMARAHHALGRMGEAATAYEWAAGRLPGLEALARYAVFLNDVGRRQEAAETLAEVDRRYAKTKEPFRKEAAVWRAFAAERVNA